jgi:tagatose-1,6-bisphosphate aldolase
VSARETASRLGRLRGLDTLSDARGIFALAAMDHRDSLRVAFEAAGHPTPAPERIAELKATVARALAPHATGLLIDVELGAPAIALGAPGPCGIVVPLEAQGYEDVATGRVTTFLPGFSPALARVLGAAACKLLLPYRPDHEASAARQDEVVSEAVAGCHAEGLALVLEPIAYALPGETPEAFAAAFPSLVVASAQRLQALGPDILKVHAARLIGLIWPGFTQGNQIPPSLLSHDPEIIRAHRADPYIHFRISARLFLELQAMRRALAKAGATHSIPTLLLQGGADPVSSCAGCSQWAKSVKPGVVTYREYPGLLHEVLNEPEGAAILEEIVAWLKQTLAARAQQ